MSRVEAGQQRLTIDDLEVLVSALGPQLYHPFIEAAASSPDDRSALERAVEGSLDFGRARAKAVEVEIMTRARASAPNTFYPLGSFFTAVLILST